MCVCVCVGGEGLEMFWSFKTVVRALNKLNSLKENGKKCFRTNVFDFNRTIKVTQPNLKLEGQVWGIFPALVAFTNPLAFGGFQVRQGPCLL